MFKKTLLPLTVACLLPVAFVASHAASLKTGKPAPGFTLTDTNGKSRSLSEFKGKFVVLEWVNHGCPFVKKHYNSGNMQSLQKEAAAKGAVWLSVCSSAEGKQGHYAPKEWAGLLAQKKSAASATLLDPEGKAGKSYGAKTTPHMFLIDPAGILVYQGAIDDRPSTDEDDVKGARNYVRIALEEAMAGKKVSEPSTDSYGCSVKYK